ncbi:hypothetical protein FHG87_014220 [Trinorchestia longiramus]|nr:hypothetical protein FHG87_014220 [Trinorchestia longiramus]
MKTDNDCLSSSSSSSSNNNNSGIFESDLGLHLDFPSTPVMSNPQHGQSSIMQYYYAGLNVVTHQQF